jgi:hypothetical protein
MERQGLAEKAIATASKTRIIALLRVFITRKLWELSDEELRATLNAGLATGELTPAEVLAGLEEGA